jgi:hypothetical protein
MERWPNQDERGNDVWQIQHHLEMPPEERFRYAAASARSLARGFVNIRPEMRRGLNFDPAAALRALVEHEVRFIVIGGMAAVTWGSPSMTSDLDICCEQEPDNLARLTLALRELGAADGAAGADLIGCRTTVGDVRCVATPPGTTGYDDLLAHSAEIEIDRVPVRFASLDDCIRMKYAADRLQDRVLAGILESLRDELRRQS